MRSWRRSLVVLVMATTAALVAPSGAPAKSFTVKATGSSPANYSWSPDERHVPKGSRVVWKNASNTTHHVVAYGGNWSYDESIDQGEKTAKKFTKTGTFRFRCDIAGHSTLNGNNCSGMCGFVKAHK